MTDQVNHRNWTRKRINAELKAQGTSQAEIVAATGRSKAMVCEVVAGRRKSQPIADAIAAALGCQPWEIWPRLYAAPAPAMSTDDATTEPTGQGPRSLAS